MPAHSSGSKSGRGVPAAEDGRDPVPPPGGAAAEEEEEDAAADPAAAGAVLSIDSVKDE